MWNRANTTNRYAPPARIWTRGFQHVKWVCRQLHHKSLTLSSYSKTTDVSFMTRVAVWISLHAWLILGFGLCIFPSHAKNKRKSSHCSNQRYDYPFILSVESFCHKRRLEKCQDILGKDVCNSLEIRIKLKLAPTSTFRRGTINWKFASHKTPKCTGLYL